MFSDLDDEISRIVVDNGSGNIQAGFAGDDAPHAIVSNMIGCRRGSTVGSETSQTGAFIGHEALSNKECCSLRYPMEHGIVTNWDDMEKIWHHTFYNELRIAPENHPVLLTEASFNPIGNREKMMQIMFEHFRLPALYIARQGILAFYASGRGVGVIVESGDGVTQTMPINEGYALPQATMRTDFAGRDLTDWMVRLLYESGYAFTTTAERELVRQMKEKHAYVALDFQEEMRSAKHAGKRQQAYKLPDGQEILLGKEIFQCPEALFHPAMAGRQEPGIADLLYETIMKSDLHIRSMYYGNIVLSGGNTMIPGLDERLKKEMQAKAPTARVIRIIAPPERKYSVWIGGSILASLSTFQKMWITREAYDEVGPSIVHRKCV